MELYLTKKNFEEIVYAALPLIEGVPSPLFIKDAALRYIYCNKSFEDLLGVRLKDIHHKRVHDTMGPETAARHEKKDRELLEKGRIDAYESAFKDKDGREHVFVYSKVAVVDRDNHVIGIIGVVADVTESKSSGDMLVLQDSAFEAAANAIVITDLNAKILKVNNAFTSLTGYSKEEAIGQTPRILRSGKQPPEFYEKLWSTIKKGRVWRGELWNKRKDGTEYIEEMTITPVRMGDEVRNFIAIKQDITERRNAVEQLRTKTEELEKFNKIAIDRELRMIELKEIIAKQKQELESLGYAPVREGAG